MLCAAGTAPGSHLLAPGQLRCAGQSEPLAVAEVRPELSWKLTASDVKMHAVRQSAYQIQAVAMRDSETDFGNAVWDSGEVRSASNLAILYAGPALEPGRDYAWRVRVWDENGTPSEWSAAAHWTQAPVWRAQWIDAGADDPKGPLPIFRKSFALDRAVKRALLYSTGLGQYEIRVNGKKVGDDELTPGWTDYRRTIDYDTYDVTSQLRGGENAVGVLLGNGMYRVLMTPGRYTKFVGDYGPPKCIVQLHIEFAGGKTLDVISDGTWKTTPGPITFSSTYGGEDFDARREPMGWDGPGFNDSQWHAAAVVQGPGGTLVPEIAPPLRVIRAYTPKQPLQPKPGLLVYDLGQNFAGWPEISVRGPAGAVVKLIPGELKADGFVTQWSSGPPQWFSYTLRGAGTETWHPRFSYYGFRYVQVEGAALTPAAGRAQILGLRGEAVHSSSKPVGDFASSDDLLNRIHTLILRAIENNSVSLFTDCPHREKLGWLEETHLMAPSILYDFDDAGIYAATARNIADAQAAGGPDQQARAKNAPPSPVGRVPEIAPQYVLFQPQWGIFDDSPEWGSAAVLAPWYLYEQNGDLNFLAAQYDVMRLYVAYLASRAKDGIIAYGLGDWYDIGPGEPGVSKLTTSGVTATAIDYQCLKVLEHTALLLGKTADGEEFKKQADAVRSAFNARFFDAAHHRYDKGSQTAQAMPLVVGLVSDDERANVLNALVADIRTHGNHVTAGDIGYHYVVDALLDGGRSDVLLDMLERTDTPSYGYQLSKGATALTEAWDANPLSSQDHFMLGHAEEWFYRGLGGIDIDFTRPADRRLVLRPYVPAKLESVHVRYDSALGPVESAWRHDRDDTVYDFAIPANATATIELTTSSPQAVKVNGTLAKDTVGIVSSRSVGSGIEIVVGSGHYEMRAANGREENKSKNSPAP
ncbi:MAG: family 78 glycoside hydrolase catalytic domain [Terracidiphilus sp.]